MKTNRMKTAWLLLEQFTSNKQNVILQGADDEIENLIRSKAKELNLDADNKNDRVKIEKICANQIGVIRDEANTKVLELEETKNKKEIELRDKAARRHDRTYGRWCSKRNG